MKYMVTEKVIVSRIAASEIGISSLTVSFGKQKMKSTEILETK